MAKLVYGLHQSLDGYVDHMRLGRPAPEVFNHFLEMVRSVTGLVYGRKLYEIMRYWDDELPEWDEGARAFAVAWRSKPKWVVSHSLESVGPNATLLKNDACSAVGQLKAELAGEIHVGGTHLAQTLTDAKLIDEYRIYLRPVLLGHGTPFFAGPLPPLRLLSNDVIGADVIRLTYVPA